MQENPPVIFLMGPTASGKTDLALKLVKQGIFNRKAEIISVDSALVYKEMNIGTAKPSQDVLLQAPHRLINCCDVSEAYSAARFCEDAIAEIQDIHASGSVPLLVGGTMLYFRALQYGLSDLPEADFDVRKKLEDQAAQVGWEKMHKRLNEIDPESAARIHPNDPQRIQRALEVYEITGEPMSALYKNKKHKAITCNVVKIAISPKDRSLLHQRIEKRFDLMLEQGFIDEVRKFFNRADVHINLPSMRAVGYRQVWEHLEGRYDRDQMRERAVVATRQFAKRQLTWLRGDPEIACFDSQDENLLSNVLKYLASVTI